MSWGEGVNPAAVSCCFCFCCGYLLAASAADISDPPIALQPHLLLLANVEGEYCDVVVIVVVVVFVIFVVVVVVAVVSEYTIVVAADSYGILIQALGVLI